VTVYVLEWGVAGEVTIRSVHTTLVGAKAGGLEYVDDDDQDVRDEIAVWDGDEDLVLEVHEGHWLHITAVEVQP
jgi:hypothetical protein